VAAGIDLEKGVKATSVVQSRRGQERNWDRIVKSQLIAAKLLIRGSSASLKSLRRASSFSKGERDRSETTESYLDGVRKAIHVARLATPSVVALGVLFLIQQSGFITGVSLPIDGGVIF